MGKVNIKINLYKITQTLQYLKRKKNIYKCNQNTNTKKNQIWALNNLDFNKICSQLQKKKNWIITWEVHPKIDYNCGKEKKMSKCQKGIFEIAI